LDGLSFLTPEVRDALRERFEGTQAMTAGGDLVVREDGARTQVANLREALRKLNQRIAETARSVEEREPCPLRAVRIEAGRRRADAARAREKRAVSLKKRARGGGPPRGFG